MLLTHGKQHSLAHSKQWLGRHDDTTHRPTKAHCLCVVEGWGQSTTARGALQKPV